MVLVFAIHVHARTVPSRRWNALDTRGDYRLTTFEDYLLHTCSVAHSNADI